MHEVLNVIVVLQEPLKGVSQVIKEEGARGKEWDRKPKGRQIDVEVALPVDAE